MKTRKDIKIAIIGGCYRAKITENLIKHCVATFVENGITESQIDIFSVPGALEIPLVSKKLAKKNIYNAIVVFGTVLKGDTYHFEQVSNECIRGCMNVSIEFEIPVIFEVLSVYRLKDAIDRAVGKKDDRGVEGAIAALKMIDTLDKI